MVKQDADPVAATGCAPITGVGDVCGRPRQFVVEAAACCLARTVHAEVVQARS